MNTEEPLSNSKQFVVAYHAGTKTYLIGIVTADGRARVDFHGDLSELTIWDAMFENPASPWGGKFIIVNNRARRTDLQADYS